MSLEWMLILLAVQVVICEGLYQLALIEGSRLMTGIGSCLAFACGAAWIMAPIGLLISEHQLDVSYGQAAVAVTGAIHGFVCSTRNEKIKTELSLYESKKV